MIAPRYWAPNRVGGGVTHKHKWVHFMYIFSRWPETPLFNVSSIRDMINITLQGSINSYKLDLDDWILIELARF